MSNLNRRIISVSVVLLLVLIIFGISYAYFTANIVGGESASTISLTAGRMVITYSGDNQITVNNIYPRAEEWATKRFALTGTNTTPVDMDYTLYLAVTVNTFSNNALSLSLTSSSSDENETLDTINSQGIPTGAGDVELVDGSFSNADGTVHTYEIKIYFIDTGLDQNNDQGKEFNAYIKVVGEE